MISSRIETFLLVATMICAIVKCQDQEYCALDPKNTMCRYPEGSGCSKIRRGVDGNTINEILQVHNELRQKVASGQQSGQPSAANMKRFVWNDNVAKVAQRWADQCDYRHDDSRSTPDFPDWVGQNIAMSSSSSSSDTNLDFKGFINMWYDEVKDFDPANIDDFKFTSGTGHYTQVAWADTYAVGCGFSMYEKDQSYVKFFVCNYAPGGNFGGRSMYKRGSPCSQCGSSGCSQQFNALCNP